MTTTPRTWRSRRPACDAPGRGAALAEGARDVLFPFRRPAVPAAPGWPGPDRDAALHDLAAARRAGTGAAEALGQAGRRLSAARQAREAALARRMRWRIVGAALALAWWLAGIGGSVSLAILGRDGAGVAVACCLPLPTVALLLADLAAGRG